MKTNKNKLGKRGSGYLTPKDRLKLLKRDWRYYKGFLQLIIENYEISEPIGPILDVGCGAGHFIYLCRLFGLDCYGIEGEENLYRECVSKGFRVYQIDLELEGKDTFPFESNFFSAILCNQVIEHLSFEAGIHMVEEIYRVLKPVDYCCYLLPANIIYWRKQNQIICIAILVQS